MLKSHSTTSVGMNTKRICFQPRDAKPQETDFQREYTTLIHFLNHDARCPQ